MIEVNLIDDRLPALVCDDSALIGGSFYYTPLRPYSPVPMKWVWEQLIRYPQAILIDVGASAGCFTLLAKHHPDLIVHSFEPTPIGARVLRENVYLNDLTDKVTVNEIAVSNYTGIGKMHVVKAMGGLGVSILDGKPATHKDVDTISMQVIRLDDYCQGLDVKPTLIKIDVEGNEKAVLEGASETIEKHHPFLVFEYSPENIDQYGYAPHDLIEMIEKWGYIWSNPEGLDIYATHKDWDKTE